MTDERGDKVHARSDALIEFSRDDLRDSISLLSKEWLVTNGLGGYASSTLHGAATRRYHGVFVPDLPSPWGRTIIMPRLDEEITTESGTFLVSGVEYGDGRLDGDLSKVITEFRREWQTPVWRMTIDGRDIEKRVIMPYGQNTVYIEYRLRRGKPVRLNVRPFVTFRMLDAQIKEARQPPFPLTILGDRYEMHFSEGAPALKMCLRPHCGCFVADYQLIRSILYRVDRDRGSQSLEDLASPGYFTAEITSDRAIAFVASTENWEVLQLHAESIFEAEAQRLQKLLTRADVAQPDDLERLLSLAADQFIVFPGSRLEESALAQASGDEARTVIAGYHWFTDWGRDTMISLDGLTLCTGRHKEARAILRTFGNYIRDGLLPNLFPEGQRKALYHTADATLWYFHALDRYYRATEDRDTLMTLYPILRGVIDHHTRGTHFGIGVDPNDGLLHAGAEGYQLTWMDAKVDDWVVTPRRGKPVEIQALWFNALRLMAEWAESLGERPDAWLRMAEQAGRSFNARFWNAAAGCLFDVVDGEGGNDLSIRPNQIFSISLRYPVLDEDRWQPVIDVAVEKLLTPVGLRSLARGHRDYKAKYFGDLRDRDAAYHQGTVWAWLIGHFIDAWLRVYKDKQQARVMLEGFRQQVRDDGIGTISEIFDAEPPYHPRGCIAQAWSVAEVLRAYQLVNR
ncbi:MAG TPA: amylo-alpha-1,6-glucosidase [Nitrospiraceae bacterium]|nr:amylo-alpha-1,6-glucosidase [Nitrospiraceae bacterium]